MKQSLLSILFLLMPMLASADYVENGGIHYAINLKTKEAEVVHPSWYNSFMVSVPSVPSNYKGDIVIPESFEYDGKTYSVTSIGFYAFYQSTLASVIIPNSVTSIGRSAFYNCSGLTSVTISNSVKSIEYSTFYGCSSLTSVTIPNSVTSIDESAFYGCGGLTSVTIPNSVTYIGQSVFANCSGLSSVTIPNSVTYIGRSAFENCNSLTSVTIPNSVTSIGGSTFAGCSGLTSVTIPNSVTSIGGSAFSGCSGLISVTIPNSVSSIGKSTFKDCSGLTSVAIPSGVTSIRDSTFSGCSGLISVTIPNSVTSIGRNTFWKCSGLTSVTIPSSVTSIGESTFYDCSSLISVKVEGGNTVYDSRNNCNAIIRTADNELIFGCCNTVIPNSVTSISGSAFYGCSGLTSVTIPRSVTSIGGNAFSGCTSIQFVKSFITEPYSISKNVFPNDVYRQASLYVPASTEKLYSRYDGWREFLKIEEMDESEQPEIPGADKCATPTISYENDKLSFSCETEGVDYKYKIEANDAKEGYGNNIQMTKTYRVTVYAFKDGMNNSDPAVANISIAGRKDGDVNGDGVVDAADVVQITNIIMGK